MDDTGPRPPAPHPFDEARPTDGRAAVLAACLIATFMAAIESTIVATAMPTIVADLGGFALFSWVFTIYLLTQAVSIPVCGRLADLYGRKPVFFVGVAVFLIGSSLCGLARAMPALVLFRAIQGFGAGAVQPTAATILGDLYAPAERARVQGLVSSVYGVSAVIGPSLGAFLVEHVTWSLVFWVNIPIGIISVAMIATRLNEHVQPRPHRIDLLGAGLMLVAVGTLMVVLVQAGSLPRGVSLAGLAIGIIALVALAVHERAAAEPMLPLELWRNRVILFGGLGGCAAGAVMMGVSAFLPAYVQGALGGSAIDGGLVLGTMSVSWAMASLAAGRVMVRTSYRLTAVLGGMALVAGALLLIALTPARGQLWAAFGALVIGLGMGFCNTTFIVSIQAAVPWRQRGAATSSTMFLRFTGQSLGAAGCGAVLNATLLALDPRSVALADRLLNPAMRAGVGPEERVRLTGLIAAGLHNSYLLVGAVAVVALSLAAALPARISPTRGG